MRPRIWLMILIFVATIFSGCTDAPTDDGPVVITDPDDFSQFGNTTGAQRPHIHDYWGGQERLTVLEFDGGVGMQSHSSSSGFNYEVFRPDTIIPLGASHVEITVSWDDAPPNWRLGDDPLELWVKTAADASAQPFTQLENGQTVTFESSNDQNDIPHQVLSSWQFVLAVPDAAEQPTGGHRGSYQFPVQMTVEAVRGLEIPPYPGHADLWQNQTRLELLEAGWSYEWAYGGDGRGCTFCNNAPQNPHHPDDGVIVPYDADHVEVIVTNTHETPEGLYLMYHGADTWEWRDADMVAEEGDTRTYHIPVDGNGDSPYALQSLWQFALSIEGDDANPQSVSTGSFEMEAFVHKEAPAG